MIKLIELTKVFICTENTLNYIRLDFCLLESSNVQTTLIEKALTENSNRPKIVYMTHFGKTTFMEDPIHDDPSFGMGMDERVEGLEFDFS